ncbi:alpha-tectorin-like isoform X1 [Mixophyes fleayi]|uniref:alpha-tectorin-like isoform X1 n=1 Tax=Mixophyes fleayi TaxID=3061075 RepID=UPI003F4D9E79
MASLSNRSFMQLLLLATSLIYIMHTASAGPVTKRSCPPDMEHGCVRTCFSNCDNLNSTSEVCTLACMPGCDCKGNLVRASKTSSVCVPPSTCNVSCPENMHFEPCLSNPEETCSYKTMEEIPCSPRCVCNEGYVSNGNMSDRKCIKRSDCPMPKY